MWVRTVGLPLLTWVADLRRSSYALPFNEPRPKRKTCSSRFIAISQTQTHWDHFITISQNARTRNDCLCTDGIAFQAPKLSARRDLTTIARLRIDWKMQKNKLDQKNVSKNDGNCSDSQFFEWLHPWFVLHPKELMHIICIAGWRLMGKAAQMMAKAAFFAGDSKKTHQHRKNNINIYIHIQYTHMHPINSSHCTGYSIGIPIWAGCHNVQKKATLK